MPLIAFTIPLVLGNLFQLTYNAADSVIVGKLLGEEALAAVGTSTPIMNIAILLISGMCMGASVLMSSQYGAQDYDTLSRQISTTLLSGCGFSAVFSLVMMFLASPVLRLIQVPEDVIPEASSYLRIVFLGLIFTFVYNFLANTMRALGDSRTPLYFLMASSVINVGMDLLFVAVLRLGVMGSAVATVLSQALCCLFCAAYIRLRVPLLCLGKRWLVFDRGLLKRTVSYGSTSAMQQVCLQVGKVIIQSVVNAQGTSVMAAFTAVNRVDDFAYTPQQNIGRGASGAHQKGLPVRASDRALLFAVPACVYLLRGTGDHGPVREGGFCPGGQPRDGLSAPDFLYVYPSGLYERDPGLFPRDGRHEGDPVQHLYEYVGQGRGGYTYGSGAEFGFCQPCLGKYGRLDSDAVIRSAFVSKEREAAVVRAGLFLQAGIFVFKHTVTDADFRENVLWPCGILLKLSADV